MKAFLLSVLFTLFMIALHAQSPGFKINMEPSEIDTNKTAKIQRDNKQKEVYNTREIRQYNFLDQGRKKIQGKLDSLKKSLYDMSLSNSANLSEQSINRMEDSVELLQKQVAHIAQRQDSLYYLYTREYMNHRNVFILNFGPRRAQAFFDLVYGDEGKRFNTLNNSGFNLGNKTGSVYTEIVSGNLGLARISLGTMVSNTAKDTQAESKKEEAYQRLSTYGGNTALNLEYPLMYMHSSNNQYNLISRLIGKGTADFPAFGTDTEDWAGSASAGVDIYGDASLGNKAMKFFFNVNAAKFYGTDVFSENLGLTSNDFYFGRITLGVVFLQNIKLSFIISSFSDQSVLRNRNVIAGGQVLH
ncbi:MAG TPA: hypothetical protein VFZ78_02995 [Flavisolibacter sp.]